MPEVTEIGLSGRVAVVVGAASGIGAATAIMLAKFGVHVAGVDVNAGGLDAVMSEIGGDGDLAIVADIAEVSECRRIVATTYAKHRRLDILVNVAAAIKRQPFEKIQEADYQRIMDVNIKSQFFLCQAALPYMKRAGWGRIINFSSPAGFVGGTTMCADYAASKAATVGLTRSIVKEYGRYNICANVICPGTIDTPLRRSGMTDEERQDERVQAIQRVPLGRFGSPQEVAYGVVYLASEWASYVTGQVLFIDGGKSCS
jgi:NAD(P)-dependent dehydrogenase (short-subunit alcohol dehydrogenase family)